MRHCEVQALIPGDRASYKKDGGGCSSHLLGLEKGFWYLLGFSGLKGPQRKFFPVPFRVLSRHGRHTDRQEIIGTLRGEKFRPRPQSKILVPLGVPFRIFDGHPWEPLPPSTRFYYDDDLGFKGLGTNRAKVGTNSW